MSSSLQSRLWLSYALLIFVVMAVVAAGLVWALIQNPRLIYPEIVINLRRAGEEIVDPLEQALLTTPQRAMRFLEREAALRNIRAVILDVDHQVIMDTGGPDLPFARLVLLAQRRQQTPEQVRVVRSENQKVWLYTVRQFPEGMTLILLMPGSQFRVLVREEFVSTFLYAGLLALLLSLLLAAAIGTWIAAPLSRMVSASRAVARGEYPAIPVEGPAEVRELAGALNDMSQQVQATQQSERDFIANVSHELKTPLTSIQGFAQAILDGAAQTPESLTHAATVIYNEADRMHRLVLGLLSIARLEAGTADLQHNQVVLHELLSNLVERFKLQAAGAQVKLNFEVKELPPLVGDCDRLAQVFTNLIDNALKFTPAGGQVTVTLERAGNDVLVSIADTGIGIAVEDQERIFERFFQVDKSRRGGEGRSVGLGLPITRQIVHAHGGKIWVESQSGQGSRFVVKLPLSSVDIIAPNHKLKNIR